MHACGNTVVCDGEDEAKRLCFDQGVSKTVTLEGTVIKASGAMEGGLGGVEGRAHRWEEKQVETLRHEKEQCQEQLNELRAARRKQAQLEALESKTKGFQSRLGFAEADLKLEQGKLQACADEARELQAQLSRLDPEVAREAEDAQQFEGEIAALRQEIDK
jgi:chromosome segregation ATPase